MGAWIEIAQDSTPTWQPLVAPRVGAWIEITEINQWNFLVTSLPAWERGLKFLVLISTATPSIVAPRVGAWIEMSFTTS